MAGKSIQVILGRGPSTEATFLIVGPERTSDPGKNIKKHFN